MADKKSLKEKRAAKLRQRCEALREVIQKSALLKVSREWIATTLDISETEAAQVASHLKKELFFHGENARGEESFLPTMYRVRK